MFEYKPLVGINITDATKMLCAYALTRDEPCKMDFNGLEITAIPSSSPEILECEYYNKVALRQKRIRSKADILPTFCPHCGGIIKE